MRRHGLIRCGALWGLIGIAGCNLGVVNPNAPDTERVLRTPTDLQALLATQYRSFHAGLYSTTGSIQLMAGVLSLENYSSLANDGMGAVVSIPRSSLNNQVGNGQAGLHRRVYYRSSESARIVSSVLAKLNEPGFTLNASDPSQDRRARAFAEFVRGISLGYVALFYDSGAVIHPGLGTEDPGELVGYQELMQGALDALQAAIDATAGGIATIPDEWIPSNTVWNTENFVRLVRTYRARLRANVARTPAERAAVNWDAVIADAENGITDDHFIRTSTTVGPTEAWRATAVGSTLWHQMTPFFLGQADVSGSYAAWIARPLEARGADGPFFMVTPDQRFPQGTTRAAQQADLVITNTSPFVTCTFDATRPVWRQLCKRYFRNRPIGEDNSSGATWGHSNYDHILAHPWVRFGRSRIDPAGSTGQNGYQPYATKAEMDLLAAEGYFRKGNYVRAAELINRTRVGNAGLPAVTAVPNAEVPGGPVNCVPKKPVNAVNAGGGTVVCGDLWEALKYEKRIETAYTHFGAWFLDNRGWGDLPENTGLHWAPPFEDYQARGRTAAIYSTGGGLSASAARSGYGW